MSCLAHLRLRFALWLCPDLAAAPAPWPADPVDLPIWPTMSRPKWWGNAEFRQYLTASHRQMRIVVVLSRIRAAPSAHLGHFAFESQGAFPAQC